MNERGKCNTPFPPNITGIHVYLSLLFLYVIPITNFKVSLVNYFLGIL